MGFIGGTGPFDNTKKNINMGAESGMATINEEEIIRWRAANAKETLRLQYTANGETRTAEFSAEAIKIGDVADFLESALIYCGFPIECLKEIFND